MVAIFTPLSSHYPICIILLLILNTEVIPPQTSAPMSVVWSLFVCCLWYQMCIKQARDVSQRARSWNLARFWMELFCMLHCVMLPYCIGERCSLCKFNFRDFVSGCMSCACHVVLMWTMSWFVSPTQLHIGKVHSVIYLLVTGARMVVIWVSLTDWHNRCVVFLDQK